MYNTFTKMFHFGRFWSYFEKKDNMNHSKPTFLKSFTCSPSRGSPIFRNYTFPAFLDDNSIHLPIEFDANIVLENLEQENSTMLSQTSTTFKQEAWNENSNLDSNKSSNQFLYCHRATQTLNNPLQTKITQSEYPPRKMFSDNLDQSVIYDSYEIDFKRQNRINKPRLTNFGGSQKIIVPDKKRISLVHEKHFGDITPILPVVKILERMINLNTFDEIAQDFSYYEDPADEFRFDSHGTLLPLWKFSFDKTRKLPVTSIIWSSFYKDLFVVSYGMYEIVSFEEQGAICGYSLKNPSYPEYTLFTKSPVLAIDMNINDHRLICAGLLDGGVMIISLHEKSSSNPVIRLSSNMHSKKHRDPCWQVKWLPIEKDNIMAFYSISSDGRICEWSVNKYELNCQDIVALRQINLPIDMETVADRFLESGTCIALHPKKYHTFLVGTQDGNIYYHLTMNSNMKSNSDYSMTFNENIHKMIIYQLVWSNWHPDIFASCSADWTIGIWNCRQSNPLFVLDLGFAVTSIAWAPYSSTVLAAVTVDRKVRVYDFSINRLEPLVCQVVGSSKHKVSLTQIVFSDNYPIILIGDSRGNTHSMKLSPNLRKIPKVKKDELFNMDEYQFNKLERLIQLLS